MIAELNDRMQWVYAVYLLGGVARTISIKRGVRVESFSIDSEDVTSAIIGLTRHGLVDTDTDFDRQVKEFVSKSDKFEMKRGVIKRKPR